MSVSDVCRGKGNGLFRIASTSGLSPIIRLDRYQKALAEYHRALDAATDNVQRCSAHKNIFVSNHYIAKIQLERNEIDLCFHFFKECLDHGESAISLSVPRIMTQEWVDNIVARVETVLSEVLETISKMDYDRRTRILFRMSGIPKNPEHKMRLLKQLILDYFHHSVSALSNGDFKTCLAAISDLFTPLTTLEDLAKYSTLCPDDELLSFLAEMNEDTFKTRCIAESMQIRRVGDDLFESTIHDFEDLDMEAVWQCIDLFKESILLTRENDIEQEAISLSRMGKVYHDVLKQRNKAKALFMEVVHLGTTLQPRNLSQEEWYRYATTVLAEYQLKEQRKEEQEWNVTRQVYLDKMKDKLNVLQEKSSSTSAQDFMVWLYKTHPPQHVKRFDVNLKDVKSATADQCKKLLAKAIVFYHPDKVDAKVFSMEYKVFCEEITKCLTSKYECFK